VYTDHAFDLAIGSPVYRNDPAISTTILYQSGLPAGVPFANQWGYASTAMDGVIARGATMLDPAQRIAAYKEFQHLANSELPIIHVAEWTFITVARDEVRNVANNPRWATSHWADCWLAQG
ncbi:MAG: ABC transporter substrate-binding protein, partial [Beijerinckiaceae bacterium]